MEYRSLGETVVLFDGANIITEKKLNEILLLNPFTNKKLNPLIMRDLDDLECFSELYIDYLILYSEIDQKEGLFNLSFEKVVDYILNESSYEYMTAYYLNNNILPKEREDKLTRILKLNQVCNVEEWTSQVSA